MKTLILNGSPRKHGDTVSLIENMTERLSGEYLLINAYYCNISPCVDCRFCRRKKGCATDDEMTAVYKYIEECDNILIASPVYFSELTGRLLDVCSRLQTYFSAAYFRNEPPVLKPKRGAVILCGGGNGKPHKAHDTAICLLHMMNAYDIFPLVCSHNTDRLPALQDKAAAEGAAGIADFFNGTVVGEK